jgi:hydroxymethylglutaryl-CoA reductase (NADPH)
MKLRDLKTVSQRREFLEKKLHMNLSKSSVFSLDEKTASTKNCENMIGVTQIPLGIAGPLTINKKEYFIPLATTEGALVASISRGCKAITESGNANAYAYKKGTTRGPVFYTGSLEKSKKLYQWIKSNDKLLKKAAESTSSHLQLKKTKVSGVADYVFVRFVFDTTDAMGMNMVTIATQKMAQVIEKETGIKCLAVAGNFDIDKKPAWINFISNRGIKAWAEIVIKKEVVKNVLKTTPENIFDVWLGKCMIGSAMSGSLGFNAQFANVIAAIFIATGQDPAHVVEGSMGITTVKVLKNGDLYFSVYLPALMIGTVGGGTTLATQQEALQIMGVFGAGKSETFAEIIAGAVLAGEISLLSSLSEGSLGKAHQRLGRGKE